MPPVRWASSPISVTSSRQLTGSGSARDVGTARCMSKRPGDRHTAKAASLRAGMSSFARGLFLEARVGRLRLCTLFDGAERLASHQMLTTEAKRLRGETGGFSRIRLSGEHRREGAREPDCSHPVLARKRVAVTH